uniref:Uncharacterized protein n=1 Tax=Moniliophthora roreri TaxID=221103 RepID=A0A0W0F859_MONRR
MSLVLRNMGTVKDIVHLRVTRDKSPTTNIHSTSTPYLQPEGVLNATSLLYQPSILATIAVVVQGRSSFRGIPRRIRVGSQITVGYLFQSSDETGSIFSDDDPLDIIENDGNQNALQDKVKRGQVVNDGTILGKQDLRIPRVAGTYRVRARYSADGGYFQTDFSSPFTAFVSDASTSSPTQTITETSRTSSRETSEPPSTTFIPFPTPPVSIDTTGSQPSITSGTATSSPVTNSATLASTSDAITSPTNTASSNQCVFSPLVAVLGSKLFYSAKNTSRGGIIAGGVIAAITVVGLLSFIFVRRYRKKRGIGGGQTSVEPYVLFEPTQERSRKVLRVSQELPQATEAVIVIANQNQQPEGGRTETSLRGAENRVAPRDGQERGSIVVVANQNQQPEGGKAETRKAENRVVPRDGQKRKSIVVHHEDSGWRPVRTSAMGPPQPNDTRVIDLPPDYDAAR